MNKKKKILALYRPRFSDQLERLHNMFDVISLKSAEDAEDIIRANQDIVAIYTAVGRNVSANIMAALPNLEIIANYGVGYDNIDIEAAKARQIVVTNTPHVVTDDTADTAMALLLNVSRRFVEGDIFVRVGKWLQGPMPNGRALTDKTVGILGLGNIGRAVAQRARAFEMSVAYTATAIKEDVPYKFYKDAEELAQHCDYLVVTCRGGEETKHLVNEGVLQKLGPEGYLINVARGSVVNTDDLVWALENDVIAGAGLDVFENEPFVDERLLKRDDVVLLPHMGTATEEVRYAQGEIVLANLENYFKGEALISPVV